MPAHNEADTHRGWRIAFALVHVAFMITNVAALVSTAGQRKLVEPMYWGISSEQLEAILSMDTWGTFGRLILLAVGVYLTALIVSGDRRVPKYYVGYGFAILAFEAALNLAQLRLWGIPRGTTVASYATRMAVYAAAMLGWVAYVWRSRQVRATFIHEPRVMGPTGRHRIGLVALALILWPFILNWFVDATSDLAGRIDPKDGTAGRGLALGILAMSVATGLFVLVKNAWRLRNVWIAVLLPVCFMALFFLYGVEGFVLRF